MILSLVSKCSSHLLPRPPPPALPSPPDLVYDTGWFYFYITFLHLVLGRNLVARGDRRFTAARLNGGGGKGAAPGTGRGAGRGPPASGGAGRARGGRRGRDRGRMGVAQSAARHGGELRRERPGTTAERGAVPPGAARGPAGPQEADVSRAASLAA